MDRTDETSKAQSLHCKDASMLERWPHHSGNYPRSWGGTGYAIVKQIPWDGSKFNLEMGQNTYDKSNDGPHNGSYILLVPAMLIQRLWQDQVKTTTCQKK